MTEVGDLVNIYVEGKRINNCSQYNVTRGVIEQPSTFSFTVGSGDLAKDLIAQLKPLSLVQITVGGTLIFTGVIEDLSGDNSGGATQIMVQGRDNLWKLVKRSMLGEKQFRTSTYFDLTKQVMKMAGYDESILLIGNNDANIAASSRVKPVKKKGKKRRIVERIETNLISPTGAKIDYLTVVGQVGETYFDFLVRHYKKAGLYLMCGGDGNPVLTIPDADLAPHYSLRRYRGVDVGRGTILYGGWANRTSQRHGSIRCYGKGRPDPKGHYAIDGDWQDFEMTQLGYGKEDVLTMHDTDAVDVHEAQYVAKRHLAAERRANRTLVYTVVGHTTDALVEAGKSVIWTPDTMVAVDDQELMWVGSGFKYIKEHMYVEKVEFIRSSSGTFTRLHLMRWMDVQYLGDDQKLGESLEATNVDYYG